MKVLTIAIVALLYGCNEVPPPNPDAILGTPMMDHIHKTCFEGKVLVDYFHATFYELDNDGKPIPCGAKK